MTDSDTLLLVLSNNPDAPIHWQRIAGDRIIAEGDDAATLTTSDMRAVAVVPAQDVTINSAELPGLSAAQARAAARLLAAENSISPIDVLHIAVGEPDAASRDILIATVARHRMESWLSAVRAAGFDPEVMVPAALLMPRPEKGYVRGALFGQHLIAGEGSAFADEGAISAAILSEAIPQMLTGHEVAASLAEMIAKPPINLRQGEYAKTRRWNIHPRLIRRAAALIIAIGMISLLIGVAQIIKYDRAASSIEADTAALARAAVPDAASDAGAIAAIDDKLAAARGGGAGFAASTAAIFEAVRTIPDLELSSYNFGKDGTIRADVTAATAEDHKAFIKRIEALGFRGQGTTPQQVAGRFAAQYIVRSK